MKNRDIYYVYRFFRLNCPEISDDDTKLMDDMAYWLEGILQTGIKEIRYFHY